MQKEVLRQFEHLTFARSGTLSYKGGVPCPTVDEPTRLPGSATDAGKGTGWLAALRQDRGARGGAEGERPTQRQVHKALKEGGNVDTRVTPGAFRRVPIISALRGERDPEKVDVSTPVTVEDQKPVIGVDSDGGGTGGGDRH